MNGTGLSRLSLFGVS